MPYYLSSDQVHVLANAFQKKGYRPAGSLISKKGLKVDLVELLYLEGYLSKKGRKYCANRKTESALEDHGFDLDQVVREDKPKPATEPDPEKQFEEYVRISDSLESASEKRNEIHKILLDLSIDKAVAGDPWDFVRRQWPELVITDPIDLEYFKIHCSRDHALDLRLDDAQVELIDYAFNPTIQEIAIKGSTSPGKGFATALLINIWYSVYKNDRITILSQSSDHAKDVMFAEVASLRKRMRYPDDSETQVLGVVDHKNTKHFIKIANPKTGEGLSGGHGEHVLFVFDEMSSVDSALAINARKQSTLIIYISNPRVLSGFFYDLYPKVEPDKNQVITDKGWRRACLTFGGHGALNVRAKRVHRPYGPSGGLDGVTLDGEKFTITEGDRIPEEYAPHTRALIPGQMDLNKYNTIMQAPDENERQWSGEGKFPKEDAEFQIISPSWLEKPCEMWLKHKDKIEVTALGLDLAASEKGDSSVLVAGGPLGIKKIFRTQKSDSMETLSWVVTCCKDMGIDLKQGSVPIAIDAIGAGGAAMGDLMAMHGATVYPMKGNRAAVNSALYCNIRAELYGSLGERLNPDSAHLDTFMIPDDDKLKEELTAHEKHYVSDMTRFYATPKVRAKGQFANVQTIKERIGRSPDSSDAVVLCHWVIRDTEFDGSIVDQLNPKDVLTEYRKAEDGNIEEVRGDGNILDVTEDQFSENWGGEPTSIEDEIALFRSAISDARKAGQF